MSYVGKEFPESYLKTVNYVDERIDIIDEARKQGKKLLLFWYPKDFTFVCPTELHAFQAAMFKPTPCRQDRQLSCSRTHQISLRRNPPYEVQLCTLRRALGSCVQCHHSIKLAHLLYQAMD